MESIHYLLMRAHSMLSRRICAGAGLLGLSPGQPKVLEFLKEHEGCDQKTIAANCEIEQATVGSILLRMEEAGLIRRSQAPGNRRSLFVYLTDKGRKAAEEMDVVFREADGVAAREMTDEECRQLKDLLKKICASLEKEKHGRTEKERL